MDAGRNCGNRVTMAWGFRDTRRAEKRRRRLRVLRFFLVLGGLVALGAAAYQSGAELVRVQVAGLRALAEKPDMGIVAEADPALVDLLVGHGATVRLVILHLEGELPSAQ